MNAPHAVRRGRRAGDLRRRGPCRSPTLPRDAVTVAPGFHRVPVRHQPGGYHGEQRLQSAAPEHGRREPGLRRPDFAAVVRFAGTDQFPGRFRPRPGEYQLEIHRASGPLRQVAITIARDAPGLFVALRPDGSALTEDAPAHAGDRLLLYGTGFGPYAPPLPDGFLVPEVPPYPLADGLQVIAAGRNMAPDFAGAAPTLAGIVLVQVQLPARSPRRRPDPVASCGGWGRE